MRKLILLYIFVTVSFFFTSCSSEKVGSPIAEFSLKTLSGQTVTRTDLLGKTVVINVWGTWCGPCVHEIKFLNKLVEKYQDDKNVVFIALAKEDENKIATFIQRIPFNYIQLPNAKSLTDHLHSGVVDEIPLHMVVNKAGIITFEMTGATVDIVDILSTEIEKTKG